MAYISPFLFKITTELLLMLDRNLESFADTAKFIINNGWEVLHVYIVFHLVTFALT